ncbi:MAG: hypothetical protein OK452_08245 [Thaumarchaeota archaeon]|nr:hypothetical protein [Nitrososphaerota archaeon]
MISQRRLAYAAAVVSISLVLGFTIPTVVPAFASINSHSANVVCATICNETKGPGYIAVWTNNLTESLSQIVPPPGANFGNTRLSEGYSNGTMISWLCGGPYPDGPGRDWETSTPSPNSVLLFIDLAPYCQVIKG